jgi:hypothetical protein
MVKGGVGGVVGVVMLFLGKERVGFLDIAGRPVYFWEHCLVVFV